MVIKFQLKGIKKLLNNFKKKTSLTEKNISKRLKVISLFMESEIKQSIAGQKSEIASVDTGRFLNSVIGNSGKETATIRSNVPYGKFLEFGTSKIAPRKHFRNSLKRNKKRIVNAFQKLV